MEWYGRDLSLYYLYVSFRVFCVLYKASCDNVVMRICKDMNFVNTISYRITRNIMVYRLWEIDTRFKIENVNNNWTLSQISKAHTIRWHFGTQTFPKHPLQNEGENAGECSHKKEIKTKNVMNKINANLVINASIKAMKKWSATRYIFVTDLQSRCD